MRAPPQRSARPALKAWEATDKPKSKEHDIATRIKTSPPPADLVSLVATSLADDKAQDVVVIDLVGKTSIADSMVIATGTSRRHIGAMAENIRGKVKASGVRGVSIEGLVSCDWVLIDAGDILIHLFRPEVREFYNIEKMWAAPAPDAPDVAGASA